MLMIKCSLLRSNKTLAKDFGILNSIYVFHLSCRNIYVPFKSNLPILQVSLSDQ